jgi:hypothetical protein
LLTAVLGIEPSWLCDKLARCADHVRNLVPSCTAAM